MVIYSPVSVPFICNQLSQSPYPNHLRYWALTRWDTIHLVHLLQGQVPLGTASKPQSQLILFKIANPKPVYPASAIPSCRKYNKGFTHVFPSLPLPPDQPWCLPKWPLCGIVCHLLGTVSNKLTSCLFSDNHLICWSHHTSIIKPMF